MFISSIFLIIVCMSIFGLILYWGAFLLSYFFLKPGNHYLFRNYYECGFKETSDVKGQLDLSFSIIGLTFLVYEFKIIIFVPIFLNVWGLQYFYLLFLVFSFFLLSISYWYEWDYYCLYWSY